MLLLNAEVERWEGRLPDLRAEAGDRVTRVLAAGHRYVVAWCPSNPGIGFLRAKSPHGLQEWRTRRWNEWGDAARVRGIATPDVTESVPALLDDLLLSQTPAAWPGLRIVLDGDTLRATAAAPHATDRPAADVTASLVHDVLWPLDGHAAESFIDVADVCKSRLARRVRTRKPDLDCGNHSGHASRDRTQTEPEQFRSHHRGRISRIQY